jgi:hypothetical protein
MLLRLKTGLAERLIHRMCLAFEITFCVQFIFMGKKSNEEISGYCFVERYRMMNVEWNSNLNVFILPFETFNDFLMATLW